MAEQAQTQQPQPRIITDFFIYMVPTIAALAPAASQTQQVIIQSDSNFILEKLTFQADIAAAAFTINAEPMPNVTIMITDAGSGRNLFSQAVPVQCLFGTGQIPFILPTPKMFVSRSTINVQATNFDAAVTYNLRFALIGKKVFQVGG